MSDERAKKVADEIWRRVVDAHRWDEGYQSAYNWIKREIEKYEAKISALERVVDMGASLQLRHTEDCHPSGEECRRRKAFKEAIAELPPNGEFDDAG